MNLGNQIKKRRQQIGWSQEQLGEKVYVTRQTISNWENGKSYLDLYSLLKLSEIFKVSLEVLMKEDMEQLKTSVDINERRKFSKMSNWYFVFLILIMTSLVPGYHFLGWIGIFIWGLLIVIGLVLGIKIDCFKKKEDIKSYREIVAFMEGKRLDEITKIKEDAKAPYQTILYAIVVLLFSIVINIVILKIMV